MSRSKVIVVSVVEQGWSKAETARQYGVSWQWVHTLVTRYAAGGLEAVEPRSRRPGSNQRAVTSAVRERVIELRVKLNDDGLDAGPATIAWHLRRDGLDPVPALSTIRRVITDAGLVNPNPPDPSRWP